jgi:predicted ATPase
VPAAKRAERLPIPPSTFIGRQEELAEIERLVRRHRLVSILGPPGIGKTRLVLEWLRGCTPWSGGVRFCDLSDATSVEDVVRFVAKALGVSLAFDHEKNVVHIGATLASWEESLLVLDNFEHVVDRAHPLVTEWLASAPQAHFLVTSRERLKLAGERVFELGPLEADGLQLFVDRARAARSSYSLAADEDGIVKDLVRELDGNPLAIELAAARTRVLSAKEILARLPERFEVLVAERRGEPRRSALLDAIAESWELLPPWGKRALADCSVFRGGFDLTSAEAVLDLGEGDERPPVMDVLEALCDKSLVAVRETGSAGLRFALHASIRAFAAQKLDEERRGQAARDRHARRFAEASEAWRQALSGADAPRALDALRTDAENLTAAIRHLVNGPATKEAADRALVLAVTLAHVLASDGPFALRASVLDDAIGFAEKTTASPVLLVDALDASVLALVAIGQPARSRANAERACAIAAAVGDTALGRAKSTLALVCGMEGKEEDALRCFDESLAHLRQSGDRLYEGRALGRLAWLDWVTGRLASARKRFEEAVAIHREVADRTFEAMNSGYLAAVGHELGDIEKPQALLEHAIDEQRALGHRRIEADLTSALGSVLHERGNLDEALAKHKEALLIYRRIGHTRDLASLLCDIARVELDRDELSAARAAFDEALPLARATKNALTIGDAEAGLGVVSAREGKLEDARRHFDRAREITTPTPRGIELVELMAAHLDLAEARAARERDDEPSVKAHLESARARLARGAATSAIGGVVPFRERRLVIASVERELADMGPTTSAAKGDVLRIIEAKREVIAPDGTALDLEKHPALWRLVEHFAEAHATSPGRAVSVDELITKGWPDERVRADAGARRVYTAISTLRRLGLRAWIVKRDDGYHLAPSIAIARA